MPEYARRLRVSSEGGARECGPLSFGALRSLLLLQQQQLGLVGEIFSMRLRQALLLRFFEE